MANEKILNSRLLLKYDTLAAWQSSPFNGDDASKYLKAGEAAVVVVNTWKLDADGNQIAVPTCLMKIGDGKTKFDNLNWIAAQAADVYDWAKKAAPDWNDFGEIPDIKLPVIPPEKQSKDYGVVTADSGTIAADALHDTFAIKGEGIVSTKAEVKNNTDTITISVDLSEYTKTEDLVDENTITTVSSGDDYISVAKTDSDPDTHNYAVSLVVSKMKELIASETTAAMDFKGVTSSLPTGAVKGDMYKVTATISVASDKDAQSVGFTAKSGDSIVCEGNNKWFLIPSGDDVEDTWRHVKVNNEQVLNNVVDANKPLEINNGTDDANKYAKFTVNGKIVKAEVVGYQPAGNYAPADDYKTKQTAHSAEGSTIKTVTKVEQTENGEVTVTYDNISFPAPPVVNDGTFTVSGIGALTGSGSMSANQATNTVANLDIADKGIKTAKIGDQAVGAEQTKAYQTKAPTASDPGSEEVWVFYSGTSTILV